ncbi:MAG TPA: PspC domain-containing protein [Steroidobacteraceae bacterium]|nr:PspC domain-containing protein [Steroidobacteraceae bacterium]
MQRISVTVGLNGSTLQFQEQAYRRLELYMAEASRALEGNPDQQEILSDLEQAVADQCSRRMSPQQSVVTLAELEPSLEEIGPVQSPGAASFAAPPPRDPARALQQVSEGAVISGVCQGLARYFGLDVTLLRIFAVLLVFLSGGGMILVYLALMLLLPYAPLEPGGQPVRKLPAKCREWVELLRAKLNLATN